MLFNSWAFAIFFIIVFFVYYAIPYRFRWILLLIASYYFYMSWNPNLVFLILATTVTSYLTSLIIAKSNRKKIKKLCIAIDIIICLGILFFYKYFNFFSESVYLLLQSLAVPVQPLTVDLILPVGISFYTFQTLSYAIDVYRGTMKVEKHFGIYALYVSFFPQLVAGPIERPQHLIPQFYEKHVFQYSNATEGIKLMTWGFFKKLAIADLIAIYVNQVYNHVSDYHGLPLIFATLLFALQIYCDFSGYSDIAKGSAKMLGFNLMVNFNSPYFSQSIREFWRRWHISLSSWFRDYVYIPLGGNRVKYGRHLLNLFLTFLISGLWHGANWTFVAWGALHGIYIVLETCISSFAQSRKRIADPPKSKLFFIAAPAKVLLTFVLVCIA